MFGAIGEKAENSGGRSWRFPFVDVAVDFGTKQKKRPDGLSIFDAVLSGDVFNDWPVLVWDPKSYRFSGNRLHILSLGRTGFCFGDAMQKGTNQPDVFCVIRKREKVKGKETNGKKVISRKRVFSLQ